MSALEPLLTLQDRDLALDRLRHRRETLPERAALADLGERVTDLTRRASTVRTSRDEVVRDEQRLADEVDTLQEQAEGAEKKLYSGEVSSPRELQALQADVEQVRRHQRAVEDRQIEAMERRDPLDTELSTLDADLAAAQAEAATLQATLAALETEIDAEAAFERSARDEAASGLDDALLGDYERTRAKANGVGAARLVGFSCQGCHLTIPATEVDRIKRGAEGPIVHCDNCGCILVP